MAFSWNRWERCEGIAFESGIFYYDPSWPDDIPHDPIKLERAKPISFIAGVRLIDARPLTEKGK
jgi:hypothetical protein